MWGFRPSRSPISRNRQVSRYQLVDDVKSLQPQDWARVIMVLIQGPEWQFRPARSPAQKPSPKPLSQMSLDSRGWKWEKEGMSSILDHVCGFHLQYEDEETPPQVKNWACKVVKLSKHKRHQDRMKMQEIWKVFDAWAANKGAKAHHLAL